MPRGSNAQAKHQLVKALVVGDGKCGKSDWAGRAVIGGFNVIYMDADVASQTISGFTKDKKNPVPEELMANIFILNVGDVLVNGGIDYRFVKTFKKFATASPTFRWNDSQSQEYSLVDHGSPTTDEVWEIKPASMDHNTVWVIDSWTSLTQSAMAWAADELGFDMEEPNRDKMRSVYQMAGEKLTFYLTLIRSAPCHVIVLAHPNEFTKTESPTGVKVKDAKETDRKVLWTKMLPKSASNNHAMQMAKYFTDIAWLEVTAQGDYKVDFRPSNEKLSGGHMNAYLGTREGGTFVDLVRFVGGTIPGEPQDYSKWLTIHDSGFEMPEAVKKPGLVLGAKSAETKVQMPGTLNLTKPK
jgi:hypothetical protein